MSAKLYEDEENGPRTTKSVGNAGGKPILPFLLAAILAVLLLVGLGSHLAKSNASLGTSSPSNTTSAIRSEAGNVANMATGQIDTNAGSIASRPTSGSLDTTVSGSSSLPPVSQDTSTGRNSIAPPGPAPKNQETTR